MANSTFVTAVLSGTASAGVVITLGTSLIAVAGFWVFLRIGKRLRLKKNNDLVTLGLGIVSGLYGILLAFVVVIVWQTFTDADNQTETEVVNVSNLYRDAAPFPASVRIPMRKQILKYVDAVIHEEFPALRAGKDLGAFGTAATDEYEGIWKDYYAYNPKGKAAEDFYSLSLTRLNDIGQYRRLRLASAAAKVPTPLWVLIVVGGMVSIAFTYFYVGASNRGQFVVIGAIGALLGFVFFLIYSLEHPFSGDISVGSDSYQRVLDQFGKGPQ